MKFMLRGLLMVSLVATTSWVSASEILTYDGTLSTGGSPANGFFDVRFRLYDGPDSESSEQIGDIIEMDNVEVWQGRLTVDLEFGPEVDQHSSGWLEIEVARSDGFGDFTPLEPRQLAFERPAGKALAIPSSAVVFFNLSACPVGWTEHTEARGRVIVGLPAGGTLGGASGTPLSNLEVRVHSHRFSDSVSTGSGGYHNHIWSKVQSVSGDVQWQSYNSGGGMELAFVWGNGIGAEGSGYYPLAAQPNQTLYTTKGGTHTHNVTIGPTSTNSVGPGFPYVQLLACRKE